MRIIISPAKKMVEQRELLDYPIDKPSFLAEAEQIKSKLQQMSAEELQKLWACNDGIAKLNMERLAHMNLEGQVTPALVAYEGIQYKYMAPGVFEDGHYEYISEHLRILSGFYGLLRPFDGIVSYRLEMQAKLAMDGYKNLYQFWGEKLYQALEAETDFILNLASKEYSKAIITFKKPDMQVLNCVFGEVQNGKIVEKGTLCKMARGQMVRFLAEHHITRKEEVALFDQLGYHFSKEFSDEDTYVFIQEVEKN